MENHWYEVHSFFRSSVMDGLGEEFVDEKDDFTTAFKCAGLLILEGASDIEIVRMPDEMTVWAAGFLKIDVNEYRHRMSDYYNRRMGIE